MDKNNNLNIAFQTFSAKAGAGISVFQSLLPAISKVDKKNKYFVFIGEDQREILDTIPEQYTKIIFKGVPKNPYIRILWEQILLPYYFKKYSIDLLYSVGNTTILFAPCKILLFVENINPFSKVIQSWTLKEKIRNKLLYFLTYLSSKRANRIRFCSHRSKDIINKKFRLDPRKSFVLYHGLRENWFEDSNKIQSPFPFNYILSVSVVAPHKNLEALIEGFSILKNKNQYSGKLVIVGDTCYENYFNQLKKMITKLSLEDHILFTGKIPNENLKVYYKQCDLFIFPSLEETFGIPLIEAMACSAPIIASDGMHYQSLFIPFNEIGKDYVLYFDPYSSKDLAEKIEFVLANRNKFVKKLTDDKKKKMETFSIKKIAEKLVMEFENCFKGDTQ